MEIAEECVDITGITIRCEEAVKTKMMKYLAEVGDPYCFRVGKTRVRVVFGNDRSTSLESGLEKILMRKM